MSLNTFERGWLNRDRALQQARGLGKVNAHDRLVDWMDYLLEPGTDSFDYGRGIIAHCLEELEGLGGQTEAPKPSSPEESK